ncbi:MAG TPA: hypothetical protein VGO80_07000 [Solirubrobacteraceae bacterium]|jgi:hypothetical protein|nr:hypothetical protein [Solirubrobacteraceae bacterium]
MSSGDFEALLAVLEDRAHDNALPPAERTKAKAAVDAFKAMGTSVGASILTLWIERQAGLA